MAIKPVDTKREKISKAQQLTMLEVLGASLVLGTCIVLAIFLMKYINFNTRIITAKNEAISQYDQSIRNVGVCQDTDGNGRLSDEELAACEPNTVDLNQIAGTLRYNTLAQMALNDDLEAVARKRVEACYDENGERINFVELYNQATDETERQQYTELSKVCTALRVVPDALPAQKNTEALMASLNQIFLLSGVEPERLAPRDDVVKSPIDGIEVIPVSLRIQNTAPVVLTTLDKIEHSIREFDITTATIEWVSGGLSLQASANAYYLSELPELEVTKTLRASTKSQTRRDVE